MQPTVQQEKQARAEHRATIEALFRAQPLDAIEPDVLRAITPHYQQRISEIRKSGFRIVNVPRSRIVDGKARKSDGAYRFVPDASEPSPERWTIPGAPYGPEPFRLRP